jgi:hypothetical protein
LELGLCALGLPSELPFHAPVGERRRRLGMGTHLGRKGKIGGPEQLLVLDEQALHLGPNRRRQLHR